MKKYLMALSFLVVQIGVFSQNPVLTNASDLIKRQLPDHYNQIITEIIPKEKDNDVFEIDNQRSKIILRGNNAVAIASGLYWYLKYTCKCDISDCGSQMHLPRVLPLPKHKIRKTINGKYRFQFNYCTLNYTASWWNWKQWEKEIDFLAMNGVNMPLSVVGLEGVLYNTLLKIGFTDEEARKFLVGPAYFAWQWMANIQSYGGPLPKSWIDSHLKLGQQIIRRYRELGMYPVQQGFSGYVPREFKEKFSKANIMLKPEWYGFVGTAQLDPLDPLFKKFGKIFYEEQKKLFGSSHFYATDPFHESEPPINTTEYLNKVGKEVFNLMHESDDKGIWVMQAWSIRKEIATVVPKNRLLILDLNGETWQQKEKFWGYPFITGNLHNFGGRINMHGDLRLLASNQYLKAKQQASNVCGTGMFMEAMGQNPVYYDLAYEMPFHRNSVDIEKWLRDYATRRYGSVSENATKAWIILLNNPYQPGTNGVEKSSVIAARPALDVKKSGPNAGFDVPYDNNQLFIAVSLLLKDSILLHKSEGYKFDLIDNTRQFLSNKGQDIQKKAASAFKEKNKKDFEKYSSQFLEMLDDVDNLLNHCTQYNFNTWVAKAQRWSSNENEKQLYDFNASMLLTQWGYDKGIEPKIYDYSWREWAGLIEGYYKPRWKYFFDFLQNCLDKNIDYSEKNLPQQFGREAINANDMYKKMTAMELRWINTPKQPKPLAKDDIIILVKRLSAKYEKL